MDISRGTVKVLLLAFLLLTACAMPYGERNYRDVGWSEVQLEPNVYALEYSGDGHQPLSMLEENWHRRAKELCPNGYETKVPPQLVTLSSNQGRARSELFTTPPIVGDDQRQSGVLFTNTQPVYHGTIRCMTK
jgi:hypothetical protein